MSKVAHIIGNGDNVFMYKPAKGLHIACNQPPFHLNFYTPMRRICVASAFIWRIF